MSGMQAQINEIITITRVVLSHPLVLAMLPVAVAAFAALAAIALTSLGGGAAINRIRLGNDGDDDD